MEILNGDKVIFVKNNWKYLLGLALLLALFYFGNVEYKEWKQHTIDQAQKTNTQTVITLPPQVINTKTETIREVAVQLMKKEESRNLSFTIKEGTRLLL